MASIKDYQIGSDIEIDGESLTTVVDGEEQDDVDIVGYSMIYTIGSDFVVPREWLKGRMEELDLNITAPGGANELMLPPKVTTKRAFNRTRDRIVDEVSYGNSEFHGDGKREVNGRVTQFASKKATNDEWHITAEAYFTADELGESYEDGEFRQVTLGVFRYNKENQAIIGVPKIDSDDALFPTWEIFAREANKMFGKMQESHVGRDIQKMLNRYTHHWTQTIKLRDGGAVYFVPAGYDESLQGLKTLIEEINENYKHRGRECELQVHPMVDSDEERRQIERRVRIHLEEQVDGAIDAAFDSLADDDSVAAEIADDLQDRLEGLEGFAGDYNALLSAKLSAQEVLKERMENLEGAKEEIVAQALDEEEPPTA